MWRIFRNTSGKKKHTPKGRPPRIRLAVERLEERTVPTNFYPDPLALDGTAGSLRDYILQANADPGSATDYIILKPGTYQLSISNPNGQENGGHFGDLDITNTKHDLVIMGGVPAP